jgi:uncharacterized membrane protein
MREPPDPGPGPNAPSAGNPSFESYPLTRPEYISALVHFYRGEMYRSQVWRRRLDTTTNWAVLTAAGIISFDFSSMSQSPFAMLLANVMITLFLGIEARRYRIFSVYRARVRMLEENFFLPLLRRNLVSPKEDWWDSVASDLDRPKFKATYLEAVLFRLRANYIWLYGVVLAAWFAKLFLHPTPAHELGQMFERMGIGPIPPGAVLTGVIAVYLLMIIPLFTPRAKRASVDEIRGAEDELDHWTT